MSFSTPKLSGDELFKEIGKNLEPSDYTFLGEKTELLKQICEKIITVSLSHLPHDWKKGDQPVLLQAMVTQVLNSKEVTELTDQIFENQENKQESDLRRLCEIGVAIQGAYEEYLLENL